MRIGELVGRLSAEFPALSISKVRYLEGEGLIRPHRVGNGYRRYSQADLEIFFNVFRVDLRALSDWC